MLTEKQIKFLNRVCRNRWTEENGVINVNESVYMAYMNLTQIPVQFGQVDGHFDCSFNKLTSLINSPQKITGSYICRNNQLTTLENGPIEVNLWYTCAANKLTNLNGAPKIIKDDFYCSSNNLTSLEGCPNIKGILGCINNSKLHILYGIGNVKTFIEYTNKTDLNEWIIEQARKDIFVTYEDIAQWIKQNNKLEFLLNAQHEIRLYFSPRILHLVDMGTYNESKILDYKKFKLKNEII